ncbi:MAG: DNA-directed RNA polymerase subunit B [Candidatus Marsarchaeota archaeon]|nr:DNA-directed RNA polymerase subunit B [Candidatus Marsarchaeota archaeon]
MSNKEKCLIFLDGRIIGSVEDGKSFVEEVKKNRRLGILPGEINVIYIKKLNEVHINADRGRARKPYIIVENGKSKLTPELKQKLKNNEIDFNYLLRRGIIEYLDAEEEENIFAALDEDSITENTTHLEIDPVAMFGFTFNTMIFQDFNQSGRYALSANFTKQAQGLYVTNFNKRYDTRAFLLYYPQIPLVNSIAYRSLKMEKHASGQNFIVAISTYYGFNMKDALILNRAAVDRGLGRSIFYKTYSNEERRYAGRQQDKFIIPPATSENYLGEHMYTKLGEDGIVEPEVDVKEGEVIVGKISPPRFLEEQTTFGIGAERMRDNSMTLKTGEEGVVDNVMISEVTGATKIVKIRIRGNKIPEVGDKFGSRNFQKGVVTLIVPPEEMPFTKDGIVPDMLLTPLSLPSRMTFGYILEMLTAKAAALDGKIMDGTMFSKKGKERIDECGTILEQHGFEKFGNEELYDGRTGNAYKSQIFTGIAYFNRLYHMVSTKLQVRSRGPVQILTRQPTEGKQKKGGIRFEEMGRDALVGYGASMVLKDRLLEQSDKAENIWVCKDCGDIGYYDYVKNVAVCPMCSGNNLEKLEISYAFKLLLDEIKSMHIFPRIKLKSE